MAISNARFTIGSLFGAVSKMANTITDSLNAVDEGVGMLNTAVKDMAERQKIESEARMIDYEATVLNDTAMQATDAAERIDEWKSQKEGRAQQFEETKSALQNKILERRKSRS